MMLVALADPLDDVVEASVLAGGFADDEPPGCLLRQVELEPLAHGRELGRDAFRAGDQREVLGQLYPRFTVAKLCCAANVRSGFRPFQLGPAIMWCPAPFPVVTVPRNPKLWWLMSARWTE